MISIALPFKKWFPLDNSMFTHIENIYTMNKTFILFNDYLKSLAEAKQGSQQDNIEVRWDYNNYPSSEHECSGILTTYFKVTWSQTRLQYILSS